MQLAASTPGYSYLATLVPMRYQSTELLNRLYTSLSAPLLLYCLESVPVLQHPFLTPFVQYLGRISFSLYIVHVPIMFTFGWWVTGRARRLCGSHGWEER
jgi:peptidoglycan/LPS O-acetylase OafA/YrhL